MKKAVIVIPTYNERGNIRPLLNAIAKVAPRMPKRWQLQVLIVDDNSPDGTAKAVTKWQQSHPSKRASFAARHVHLLNNPLKAGLGCAYIKGLDKAFFELKADAAFMFDADLSHDPTKIPELMVKFDQGFEMVIGSRYVPGGDIPANWDWHRKFLSHWGNKVIRYGLGYPEVKDWTTGYRLFSRRVYRAIKPELTDNLFSGYTMMVAMIHQVVKQGFKVAEVPFVFKDRTYGESKLGLEYIINTLWYLARTRLLAVKPQLEWQP